jgi:hypothetical protein
MWHPWGFAVEQAGSCGYEQTDWAGARCSNPFALTIRLPDHTLIVDPGAAIRMYLDQLCPRGAAGAAVVRMWVRPFGVGWGRSSCTDCDKSESGGVL